MSFNLQNQIGWEFFGVQVMTIIAMLADEVPQVVLPKALMALAAEWHSIQRSTKASSSIINYGLSNDLMVVAQKVAIVSCLLASFWVIKPTYYLRQHTLHTHELHFLCIDPPEKTIETTHDLKL